MNRGLYSGVEAMAAAEKRLESIATNLANVSVHGYKRRGTATESFDRALAGSVERHVRTRTRIDYAQGALESTGEPFDLALAGAGFFALETPQGEAYTRGGRFHLDAAGTLQTQEGFPVAWEGARGTIDPQGEEVRVDPDGQVWQGSVQAGRLRLVDFAQPARLQPDRMGYLHASADAAPRAREGEVRQGHLERSNVSALDEMVALISTQRSYESAAKLMSSIEQGYRRLTSR
jgi:flagellar basal-body rod protein FlgF